MKITLTALLLALSIAAFGSASLKADSYTGYPDWAKEAFEGADDRGPDGD